MTERAKGLTRRHFLLTAGASGVVAAAAIALKSAPPALPAVKGKRATRGYHASEHVNNYYRTTKV
jgi:hypothetical protein